MAGFTELRRESREREEERENLLSVGKVAEVHDGREDSVSLAGL